MAKTRIVIHPALLPSIDNEAAAQLALLSQRVANQAELPRDPLAWLVLAGEVPARPDLYSYVASYVAEAVVISPFEADV